MNQVTTSDYGSDRLPKRLRLVLTAILIGVCGLWYAARAPRDWGSAQGFEYEWIAQSIASGHGYSFDAAHRWLFVQTSADEYFPTAWVEPAYTYLMAGVMMLVGASYQPVLVFLNFVFVAVTAGLLFGIGRRLGGHWAGVLAVMLWLCHPHAHAVPAVTLNNVVLSAMLISLVGLLLLRLMERVTWRRALALAVAIGVGALNHVSLVLFAPLCMVLVLVASDQRWRPQALTAAILIGVVSGGMVLPWTLRNYLVFERFIPVRSGSGSVLTSANPMLASTFTPGLIYGGIELVPPWTSTGPVDALEVMVRDSPTRRQLIEYKDSLLPELAQREGLELEAMNEADRDSLLRKHTKTFMREHPGLVVRMMLAKTSAYLFTNWPRAGLLTALALLSVAWHWRNPRVWGFLLMLLVLTFPFSLSLPMYYRYRFTLEPIVCLLVGLLLARVIFSLVALAKPTFLYRTGLQRWPRELADKYVGPYQSVYFSHAADAALRDKAASGGSVSALLIHLLETDRIQGALVLTTVIEDGKARPKFMLARSRKEIMAAQGSKYAAVHFTSDAMPLIREFPGHVAVVVLPCDTHALHRLRQREPELDGKVKLVITLLCGHNSEPVLTDLVVSKLGAGHGKVADLRWRSGHWRGQMSAVYEDGAKVVVPFSRFSMYRNLYFFAQRKCHHCHDHYGYYGDISAGDIWSLKARQEPIKKTGLIIRTDAGRAAVESALADKVLVGRPETIDDILDGQSRTMPFHYNVSARARLAPLFGFRIKDAVHEKVRWIDYPVAFICLLNERVSRTAWGQRVIMAMPRPVIRAYLYFFKALELL